MQRSSLRFSGFGLHSADRLSAPPTATKKDLTTI
jgi:hypothetical protein